jgi:hypothetical protein
MGVRTADTIYTRFILNKNTRILSKNRAKTAAV